MNDEIVVENSLTADGQRCLHVMGNTPIGEGWLGQVPEGIEPQVKRYQDGGVNHLVINWRAREWVEYRMPAGAWRRLVLLWTLVQGVKASEQLKDACVAFALRTGRDPQFGFMRAMPRGAEEGMSVFGMMLIGAEWVPAGFVALWSDAVH